MSLENITRQEFGDWYYTLVDQVLRNLNTPNSTKPDLKNIEELLKPTLSKVKKDVEISKLLQTEGEEPLFLQHDNLYLARHDEYRRIEEFALPTFIFPKPTYALKTKSEAGASAMSYHDLRIPLIVCREHEQVVHHETQHYVFKLLSDIDKIPFDRKQSIINIVDFSMYKNELLSRLVENQSPIGYTLHNLRGIPEESTEYTTMHANMFYDLFPALVDASKKQKVNSREYIKGTFLAKNFEELFYNIMAVAKGTKMEEYRFKEIDFASKEYEEHFLKNITLQNEEKPYRPENPFEIIS